MQVNPFIIFLLIEAKMLTGDPVYMISFSLILAVVAFLYGSVGHGGASGYLALMALFGFSFLVMKPTALILNIFVSGISFYFFRANKFFKWKLFYPFAITSIPAAFVGGGIPINATLYKQILGVFLFLAILRILGFFGKAPLKENITINIPLALAIGLGIGFFAGMIGIGGGIILSPVILLLGWGNLKESAAVSALFIFANSISGALGFVVGGGEIPSEALYLIPAALIGGTLGSYYGSSKFSFPVLKYILSGVLFIAFIKLMTV
jgi:uncharacterized protein